jgi:hypothetical protein
MVRHGSWLLLISILGAACGSTEECKERSYGPEAVSAVSCAVAAGEMTLTLSAAPCWGKPDRCTFSVEGTQLTVALVAEFCDSGGTQATGCADPTKFDCSGPELAPGSYTLGSAVVAVAADRSCQLAP